jgi:hypothetical protein
MVRKRSAGSSPAEGFTNRAEARFSCSWSRAGDHFLMEGSPVRASAGTWSGERVIAACAALVLDAIIRHRRSAGYSVGYRSLWSAASIAGSARCRYQAV